MSLHFVTGGTNLDKTGWLCETITREAAKHPKTNYLMLVPEQFTMQTQREFVVNSAEHCILNIDILSFLRFADRIFSEIGQIRYPILDDLGKSLILRKVVEETKEELLYLRADLKKTGFIDEIKSFLSEMFQYDIDEVRLEKMEELCENKGVLRNKIHDIRLIMDAFYRKLEEHYMTTEGMYDVLSERMKESDWLKNSVIALDGYTGFTPVQLKVIEQMLCLAKDVYLVVDIDYRELSGRKNDMFTLAHETMHRVGNLAKQHQVVIEDPVRPDRKRIRSKELEVLERNLFRYSGSKYKEQTKDILVYSAVNPDAEAECVVSQIRKLLREEGYRYRDLAVITADMDSYGRKLVKLLENAGISCFYDEKVDLSKNLFIRYLHSYLSMFVKGFSYESVIDFIKNPYSGFTMEQSDRLDNYLLAMGIEHLSQWKKEFRRNYRRGEKEDLTELNEFRVQFLELVSLGESVFKKPGTIVNYTECLYDFIVATDGYRKLEEEKICAEEAGNPVKAKEYDQIYESILRVLDKLVETLADETIDVREYLELLEIGWKEEKIGVLPPGLDTVVIGDMERTRLNHVKVLFLMGVNEGVIPKGMDQGGILSEVEREFLDEEIRKQECEFTLAPSGKKNAVISQFYLYLNLTKPEEKLFLTYSDVGSDGKKKNPSYIIKKIGKLYDNLTTKRWGEERDYDYYLGSDFGMKFLIQGIREYEKHNEWEEAEQWEQLFLWYKENFNDKLTALIDKNRLEKRSGKLSKEAAKILYGKDLISSITRFENFAQCPLSHFLNYGLTLEERQEYKVSSPDFGILFHNVMKLFFREMKKEKLSFRELEEKKRNEMVEQAMKEALEEYDNDALYANERSTYMVKRLERMCKRSIWAICHQVEKGDFIPSYFEKKFGNQTKSEETWIPVTKTERMAIQGVIDRIDYLETEDTVLFRVIDYKTGHSEVNLDQVYYGLQLQLFLYLSAAKEILASDENFRGKRLIPAGVYYYNMNDPVLENDFSEDDSEVGKKLFKELRMKGITNYEEQVPEHTDHNLTRNEKSESDVIGFDYTAKGEVGRYSKTLGTQAIQMVSEHVKKQMVEFGKQMYDGNVAAAPAVWKTQSGCQYCGYSSICSQVNSGKAEREFEGIKDYAEIIKRMQEKGVDVNGTDESAGNFRWSGGEEN